MKKTIIIAITGFILISIMTSKDTNIIIPNNAIRFRIIANSNKEQDQKLKLKVRDKVQSKIYTLLSNSKTEQEARKLIKSTLPEFEIILQNLLINENQGFKINYGLNYFPQKNYKGVEYPEGKYESIVITLGDGLGDNWWCVMFPPLCLLEAEETNKSDVEYKFFVQEIFANFFSSN